MAKSADVVIIGAGPGGYPAAIRAAQLGKKVVLIEKGTLGGECLNWGCIPSKALITAASFYHKLNNGAEEMGISVSGATIDITKLMAWKQAIQDKLIDGIKVLLKTNKVETIIGSASFNGKSQIEVDLDKKKNKETINFKSAIVATGAEFISLPEFELDEIDILSAKGALSLDHIPEELVCIGGGIVGLELGTVFAKLGSKVKVIELLPNLMTGVTKRLVSVVERKLKELGIEVYKEAKATKMVKKAGKLYLTVETKTETKTITGNKILLSIGKRALTSNIGLEKAGVNTGKGGFISVNTRQQTNVSNIYAVGDCTGQPFLAHRATKQGIVAAEVIAGKTSEADFKAMPGAIFTDPEIAYAGLSEAEAKKIGFDVRIGQASFAASGRAMTQLADSGFVKVISDDKTGVILGIEIVGPHASDLISEAALALEMGATVEDLGFTVHPHPTLPEMVMEAAEAIEGKAIHVPNTRKRKI